MAHQPLRVSKRMLDSVGPGIFVTEAGTGPLLLLLHGIGSSGASWLPVLRQLAEHFHLVMPDWWGHGGSGTPGGYLLHDYAADLDQLIDVFGEQPIILGHSLGALVATTWAIDHPAKARGIILEDMPLTIDRDGAGRLTTWVEMNQLPIDVLIARYQSENPHWTAEDCHRRAEVLTSVDVRVFLELRDLAMTGNGLSMLSGAETVQSRLHLIYGDIAAGGLISDEMAAVFCSQNPGFSTKQIPGASHSIHRDATEPFLKEVLAYLNQIGIDT